jgi:hypothetical protein
LMPSYKKWPQRLPDFRRLIGALARTESVGSSLSEEISRLAPTCGRCGERRRPVSQTAPVEMLFLLPKRECVGC